MKRLFAALVFMMLALSSLGVQAQFGGGMKRDGAGGRDQRSARSTNPKDGDAKKAPDAFAGGVDAQLADTGAKLKLGPEQWLLWDRYQTRVLALMDDQMHAPAATAAAQNALQQIDRKVDTVRNRLAAMEDIADSAHLLYASLNTEQKAIADQLLPGTLPALYSGLMPVRSRAGRPQGSGDPGARPSRDEQAPNPAPQ